MEDANSVAAKETCLTCGTVGLLNGDDGFFYCGQCGTMTSDLVDAGIPDEDFVGDRHAHAAVYDARHSRRIPSAKAPVEKPPSPEECCQKLRMSYVSGLQVLINLQCEALVSKFSVNPMICGVTGSIWMHYLKSTRVFADGWAHRIQLESESEIQGSKKMCTKKAGGKDEPRNRFNQRMVMIWFNALQKAIPLSTSLEITYLACHFARVPLLPTDVCKWTCEGKLPYLAAFVDIEKTNIWTNECLLSSSLMFKPTGVVPLNQLEASAARIAEAVGLQLPPVNFYAIASRYLKQLSLPVAKILSYACELQDWSNHPYLRLSTCESRMSTRVCVMSMLIVTIRILYNLNGFGKWEASLAEDVASSSTDSQPSVHKLEHEASRMLRSLEKRCFHISKEFEFSKNLESYLRYCNNVVFAGLLVESDVEEKIIERLWSFYLKNKTEAQEEVGINNKQTDSGSSRANKESRVRVMEQLMDENGFCYIPPRKNVKQLDYLTYPRKKDDGLFTYVAHADYYILLHACAREAQVSVRIMHQGVRRIETWLESIEKRVDVCLHKIAE